MGVELSWTPPAGGEDPSGVGVKEPPSEDRGSDDQKAEGLVAAEGAALELAALSCGDLFLVRLDAAFDHAGGRGDLNHHASV